MDNKIRRLREIGKFRLNSEKKELFYLEKPIDLPLKEIELLCVLTENGGELISKEELLDRVWKDSFVDESNLTRHIYRLRKMFAAHGESEEIIQNVPRRGYRFTGKIVHKVFTQTNVEVVSEHFPKPHLSIEEINQTYPPPSPIQSDPLESKINFESSKSRTKLLAIGLIALIATIIFWSYQRPPQSNRFPDVQVRRLTNTSNVFETAISPDGKFLLYVEGNSGLQSLRLKHIATQKETQLIPPVKGRYRGVAFALDGGSVFYAHREQNSSDNKLYQLSILGGSPKMLLSGVDSAITFSPDGARIAFVREDIQAGEWALIIANANGTVERKLASHHSPEFYSVDGPSWSPNGKYIAAALGSKTPNFHYRIIAIEVANGLEKTISAQQWDWAMKVAWLSDNSGLMLIARLKSNGTNNQVWRLDFPSGQLHRITHDLNDYRGLSLTSDNKSLVTVQRETRANIWVIPNGNMAYAKPITGDAVSQNGIIGIDWTPDGKIIYTSFASNRWGIWIMNDDGTGAKLLTDSPEDNDYSPSVSSDGRYIIFASSRSGSAHIWRMGIDGSELKELSGGDLDRFPQCAPKGNWIIYSSEKPETGMRSTVAKISLEGGKSETVSDKQTDFPIISPNEKQIACVYQEETNSSRKIALFSLENDKLMKTLDIPVFAAPSVRWHPNGKGLCFLNPQDQSSNIWLQPLLGGRSARLTNFDTERIFTYAWSRDGLNLACVRGTLNSDVVMISNFK